MTKQIPNELRLNGSVELTAQQDAEKRPRFFLIAYTGGLMRPDGFYEDLVVDLEGAKFDKVKTPVIADHDIAKRIGHTIEQAIIPAGEVKEIGGRKVKGPAIVAYGEVSSSMGVAQGFVADARNGFPFQVSIGADILKGQFIGPDETAVVNGKEHKGPFILVSRSRIRELSITVLGADNRTKATIAATRKQEPFTMDFKAFVKNLGFDPEALTDEQREKLEAHFKEVQAKSEPKPKAPKPEDDQLDPQAIKRKLAAEAAREEKRIDMIRATATRFEALLPEAFKYEGEETTLADLKAKAIAEGWSVDQFELACLRAARPERKGPAIQAKSQAVEGKALEVAILRAYGKVPMRAKNPVTGREYGLEVYYDEKTLEAAEQPQYQCGGSIQALLDLQIRAAGMYYPGTDRRSSEFVAASHKAWQKIQASGFSTLNITNILENVMHKTALAAFEAAEVVWPFIAGRRNLNDFRPHTLYRITKQGSFAKVSPDGELKHISMSDEKHSIEADTYGAMLTIDRKTIVNDDLGIILDQARAIGQLGAQRIEESVFVLLLSNPGSFFSAANGNLLTGATSALSVDALDKARQLFRNQVDANGKPINVSPRVLLVPTTLETTANRLFREERLDATGSTNQVVFVNNPHRGLYRPYVSPYLNNTNITDENGNAISGQSDTQWYLMADPNAPQGAAIVVGFLNGRDTPYVDQAETQFSVPGGIQFRAYLDWGVAMHVPQLAVKSTGA